MENPTKLSIQVSLNGLSFCVLDISTDTVLKAEKLVFAKKRTPYGLLRKLKALFMQHDIRLHRFSEVVVVHRNNLFGLVPQSLFDADELPNYLKFNAKILANDHMAYDALENCEIMNVFVPFVNVNNFIYEGFGEFTFKHHGTVMLESLSLGQAGPTLDGPKSLQATGLNNPTGPTPAGRPDFKPDGGTGDSASRTSTKEPVIYVHIFERQMDVAVVAQRKLMLFNSFDFVTPEDFLYYLLFIMEQLQLDANSTLVKLFGDIEEGDDLYGLCYRYVTNVAVIVPDFPDRIFGNATDRTLDFTVLNAL